MATKKAEPSNEETVIEATISVQPRGKSVAVFTVDYGGSFSSGKIELNERQIRLVKRLILDLTGGKEPQI